MFCIILNVAQERLWQKILRGVSIDEKTTLWGFSYTCLSEMVKWVKMKWGEISEIGARMRHPSYNDSSVLQSPKTSEHRGTLKKKLRGFVNWGISYHFLPEPHHGVRYHTKLNSFLLWEIENNDVVFKTRSLWFIFYFSTLSTAM